MGPKSEKIKNVQEIRWKRLLWGALIGIAASILLFLGGIWYLIASAPDIDTITVSPLESATYICDADGNSLRKLTLAASNRDIVSLEEIPESLQHAIVAIEDERFYEHGGIDVRGIARAFVTGIARGSFSEGASTITQQLIKNSVFTEWTQENSFVDRFSRKVQEQYLALQLEKRMSKEEILQHYLNTINLGAGCYGVQAASRRYFGKNVSELTLSESAVLAAIPQNPTGYNPILYPEANQKRAEVVLSYMLEQGFITESQMQEALADDVYARIREYDETYEEEKVYTYYEDALIDQALELLCEEKGWTVEQAYRAVYSGGLRIFSAQDSALQQICDEEFSNPENFPSGTQFGIDYALSITEADGQVTHFGTESLRTYIRETTNPGFQLLCTSQEEAQSYAAVFQAHILDAYPGSEVLAERLTLSPQPQASLVLLDQYTGFVKAVVGGRGEKTASLTLNRATETTRQPGSTFKILAAYAPALDAFGQTLATEYENEPYRYENGTTVSNWDLNDYSGTVTIREAITRSINVVAVRCITEITPQTGFDYTRRFGISTLHESYESGGSISSDVIQPLALGGITQGVTNLELCAAYGAIANSGSFLEPRFFTKILDRHGNVILDYTEQESISVIQDSTAFLLTSAMQDVVADSSGTAYGAISASGQPVAGKTGTTSNYKDIWFVGYTPYYTCCVWGGYDNNSDLPDGARTYSKTLWSAVMNRVHSNLSVLTFRQPDSVTSVTLCSESHLLAVPDACPHTYTEYFAAGTEPEAECTLHEPIPETEPIYIYPDLLDELLTESESESESETDSETESETDSELDSETSSEEGILPEITPGSGNESGSSPGISPDSGNNSGAVTQPPSTGTPDIEILPDGSISGPIILPGESQTDETESESESDTSSFEDLIRRLNLPHP